MFGLELKPASVSWVNPPEDTYVRLSNAVLVTLPEEDRDFRIIVEMVPRPDEGEVEEVSVAIAVLTNDKDTTPINVVCTPKVGLRISEKSTNFTGVVIHLTGDSFFPSSNDMFESPRDLPDILQRIANEAIGEESDGDIDVYSNEGDAAEAAGDESNDDDATNAEESEIAPVLLNKEINAPESKMAGDGKKKGHEEKGNAEKKSTKKRSARDGQGEQGPPKKKSDKSIPVTSHPSGLRYQDMIVGVGKPVKKGHHVAIQYKLRLDNGKVVDKADRKRPFKFRLGIGECIKGMDIGVVGMREGGERHIVVPPELGYGDQQVPGIPTNSTLYFDVTVVKAF